MKLRLDLLEHLKDEDILEEVLANNHRYKPEPLLSKTGVGSLSSASTEERAQEAARSEEVTFLGFLDFLKAFHRRAPFLFFNGNTFTDVARQASAAIFAEVPTFGA